jgi:hypothetical protein
MNLSASAARQPDTAAYQYNFHYTTSGTLLSSRLQAFAAVALSALMWYNNSNGAAAEGSRNEREVSI